MNEHLMSPTAVMIVLLIALFVDWMSVGPNSIRDRIAFCLAVPAIYEGFNGGPLDRFTVEALGAVIDQAKHAADGSYIAGAITPKVIGALAGGLFIYTIGCLAPEKWSNRLGPFARLAFSGKTGPATGPAIAGPATKRRLNVRLWACAALIGVLCDLPDGLVGEAMDGFVGFLDWAVAPLPVLLFGGA